MLTCQRELFSLPPTAHYLNCAYLSPLLKNVEAAGIEGVRRKSDPTRITAEDFYADVEALRDIIGRLVNASPERVAMVPAASYGMALAVHNTPLKRGQNVVTPGEEFPSGVYGWMDLCRAAGGEMRMVPRPTDVQHAGQAWQEALEAAIDDRTAVVSLTDVHWTDGTRFDLARLTARARAVGAMVVVDGTQSVGAAPFDFDDLQPDLLVVAGYKWCLGPYSYSFAVVGDRLLEGKPFEMNWIGREDSEDFSQLINYRETYRPGARRFDSGEHSNFALVPMLAASLTQILEWGVENIQAYCASLGDELTALLAESEFALPPRQEHAAHMFGIHIPDAERVPLIMEALAAREIYVSLRGNAVRVSPHLYNSSADVQALAEALLSTARR